LFEEDPEAKFIRERCIRVAAISIMIWLGVSNICVVGRNKKPRVFFHQMQQNVRCATELIFDIESGIIISYC
jgi:hypothetical protein